MDYKSEMMSIEMLKMGLLLLVGFLFGGYHFDAQVRIPDDLSKHHRIKLKESSISKAVLIFRDKNQRRYFSTVAVYLQMAAYILALANFLFAISITDFKIAAVVIRVDYGFGLLGCCIIIFFDVFYRMKKRKR